ncbi:MAG: PIG-L family deacetylase [Thermoproteales archaeon]|nr:PIG-L family deacetylase [Thermoproteales archaeon]
MVHIAVIGAHAGDAELMAGGIAAEAISQGLEVYFIHMTLGEKGHPTLSPKEYGEQKRKEALLVAEKIEAKVIFMPYKDGELYYNERTIIEIAKVLREIRPKVVITHWRGSLHKDHTITHDIVRDAVFYAAIKWFDIGGKENFSRIYYAENWEDSHEFQKDIYISISPESYKKWISAVKNYAFVRGETGFPYDEYYSNLARIRGIESYTLYAQVLMKPWYAKKEIIKKIEKL